MLSFFTFKVSLMSALMMPSTPSYPRANRNVARARNSSQLSTSYKDDDSFYTFDFAELFNAAGEPIKNLAAWQKQLIAIIQKLNIALGIDGHVCITNGVSIHTTGQEGAYIHVKHAKESSISQIESASSQSGYRPHAYSILLHNLKVKVGSGEEGTYAPLTTLLDPATFELASSLLSFIHQCTRVAAKPLLAKRKNETRQEDGTVTIDSWIVGRRHNSQEKSRVGDAVILMRNPHDRFDPNAIEVLSSVSGLRLGYVPTEQAAELAPIMDTPDLFKVTACISAGKGDQYKTPILIAYSQIDPILKQEDNKNRKKRKL